MNEDTLLRAEDLRDQVEELTALAKRMAEAGVRSAEVVVEGLADDLLTADLAEAMANEARLQRDLAIVAVRAATYGATILGQHPVRVVGSRRVVRDAESNIVRVIDETVPVVTP